MTVEDIVLHLRIDGYCILEGVIPKNKVAAIRESIVTTTASLKPTGSGEVPGERIRGIINFDQSFAPYLSDGRIIGACEELLGPHVRIHETLVTSNITKERGRLHPDWPFAQDEEAPAKITTPYPNVPMGITTIWMLTPFTPKKAGTILVPGTHLQANNPTGDIGIDCNKPYPTEVQITGSAGSVLMFDGRIWHAAAVNQTDKKRTMLRVLYTPWWLNLDIWREGSEERYQMVDEAGKLLASIPLVPRTVYEKLPEDVKPLFRHWVAN